MAEYIYRCPKCSHEIGAVHSMLSVVDFYCPECGEKMNRKPQVFIVDWGGHKPSKGETVKQGRDYDPDTAA